MARKDRLHREVAAERADRPPESHYVDRAAAILLAIETTQLDAHRESLEAKLDALVREEWGPDYSKYTRAELAQYPGGGAPEGHDPEDFSWARDELMKKARKKVRKSRREGTEKQLLDQVSEWERSQPQETSKRARLPLIEEVADFLNANSLNAMLAMNAIQDAGATLTDLSLDTDEPEATKKRAGAIRALVRSFNPEEFSAEDKDRIITRLNGALAAPKGSVLREQVVGDLSGIVEILRDYQKEIEASRQLTRDVEKESNAGFFRETLGNAAQWAVDHPESALFAAATMGMAGVILNRYSWGKKMINGMLAVGGVGALAVAVDLGVEAFHPDHRSMTDMIEDFFGVNVDKYSQSDEFKAWEKLLEKRFPKNGEAVKALLRMGDRNINDVLSAYRDVIDRGGDAFSDQELSSIGLTRDELKSLRRNAAFIGIDGLVRSYGKLARKEGWQAENISKGDNDQIIGWAYMNALFGGRDVKLTLAAYYLQRLEKGQAIPLPMSPDQRMRSLIMDPMEKIAADEVAFAKELESMFKRQKVPVEFVALGDGQYAVNGCLMNVRFEDDLAQGEQYVFENRFGGTTGKRLNILAGSNDRNAYQEVETFAREIMKEQFEKNVAETSDLITEEYTVRYDKKAGHCVIVPPIDSLHYPGLNLGRQPLEIAYAAAPGADRPSLYIAGRYAVYTPSLRPQSFDTLEEVRAAASFGMVAQKIRSDAEFATGGDVGRLRLEVTGVESDPVNKRSVVSVRYGETEGTATYVKGKLESLYLPPDPVLEAARERWLNGFERSTATALQRENGYKRLESVFTAYRTRSLPGNIVAVGSRLYYSIVGEAMAGNVGILRTVSDAEGPYTTAMEYKVEQEATQARVKLERYLNTHPNLKREEFERYKTKVMEEAQQAILEFADIHADVHAALEANDGGETIAKQLTESQRRVEAVGYRCDEVRWFMIGLMNQMRRDGLNWQGYNGGEGAQQDQYDGWIVTTEYTGALLDWDFDQIKDLNAGDISDDIVPEFILNAYPDLTGAQLVDIARAYFNYYPKFYDAALHAAEDAADGNSTALGFTIHERVGNIRDELKGSGTLTFDEYLAQTLEVMAQNDGNLPSSVGGEVFDSNPIAQTDYITPSALGQSVEVAGEAWDATSQAAIDAFNWMRNEGEQAIQWAMDATGMGAWWADFDITGPDVGADAGPEKVEPDKIDYMLKSAEKRIEKAYSPVSGLSTASWAGANGHGRLLRMRTKQLQSEVNDRFDTWLKPKYDAYNASVAAGTPNADLLPSEKDWEIVVQPTIKKAVDEAITHYGLNPNDALNQSMDRLAMDMLGSNKADWEGSVRIALDYYVRKNGDSLTTGAKSVAAFEAYLNAIDFANTPASNASVPGSNPAIRLSPENYVKVFIDKYPAGKALPSDIMTYAEWLDLANDRPSDIYIPENPALNENRIQAEALISKFDEWMKDVAYAEMDSWNTTGYQLRLDLLTWPPTSWIAAKSAFGFWRMNTYNRLQAIKDGNFDGSTGQFKLADLNSELEALKKCTLYDMNLVVDPLMANRKNPMSSGITSSNNEMMELLEDAYDKFPNTAAYRKHLVDNFDLSDFDDL